MKRKQIPFSLEMVKKIQAGEVKGCIKTRNGRKARFLGKVKSEEYPLVFAIEYKENNEELSITFTASGKQLIGIGQSALDIILEIEETKQEYQFKPFDKVLVRGNDASIWQAGFYSHFETIRDNDYYVTTAGDYYLDGEIIPYAGNENLLGTTDKPKED